MSARFGISLWMAWSVSLSAFAQLVPIGQWRDELVYKNANGVAAAQDRVYCSTESSVYSVHLTDFSMEKLTKVTGLSDIATVGVYYSQHHQLLLIIYANSNIDIFQQGEVHNISDIKRKNILGDKTIYSVHFSEDVAYLACGFGVVVLDLKKREIKDTYSITSNPGGTPVKGIADDGTYLYVTTTAGVFRALKNDPFLVDFNRWTLLGPAYGLYAASYSDVVQFQDKIYLARGDSLFVQQGDSWILYYRRPNCNIVDLTVSDSMMFASHIGNGCTAVTFFYADGRRDSFFSAQPKQAVWAGGYVWIADLYQGLLRVKDQYAEPIYPNGPYTSRVFALAVNSNSHSVYVAPGGWTPSYYFTFNRDGFFTKIDGWWSHYNYENTPGLTDSFDFVAVAIYKPTGRVFFGSLWNGLVEFDDTDKIVAQYSKKNSTLAGTVGDSLRVKATGIAFDRYGNMWVSNLGALDPIVCRKADGQWLRLKPSFPIEQNWVTHVLVDNYDQVWFVLPRNGLMVLNHGGSLESTADDQYKKLINVPGSGNLPTLQVNCFAKDQDGTIWVGTDQGIAVFYCPGALFSASGCEAQRIVVTSGGFAGYLLETEIVNTIAIDGANRKWIGTNNGLWLFSADGTQQLAHFTADNSPLFSNNVLALAIDQGTGEVYVGTDRGIIVYRGDAIQGTPGTCQPLVYPNPVRENYQGPVVISGLGQNAEVKITDAYGDLVYQTKALGGQALWDGRTVGGRRVPTGVYMVWSMESNGSSTCMTRLLVIGNE